MQTEAITLDIIREPSLEIVVSLALHSKNALMVKLLLKFTNNTTLPPPTDSSRRSRRRKYSSTKADAFPRGGAEFVKLLLEKGADLNTPN
jgi:hypothetical protein